MFSLPLACRKPEGSGDIQGRRSSWFVTARTEAKEMFELKILGNNIFLCQLHNLSVSSESPAPSLVLTSSFLMSY